MLCVTQQQRTVHPSGPDNPTPEHVSGVERERSGECSGHISFRAENAFLKIQRRSLNPKCPLVICQFENLWNRLSNSLSKLMFLKANSKIM